MIEQLDQSRQPSHSAALEHGQSTVAFLGTGLYVFTGELSIGVDRYIFKGLKWRRPFMDFDKRKDKQPALDGLCTLELIKMHMERGNLGRTAAHAKLYWQ